MVYKGGCQALFMPTMCSNVGQPPWQEPPWGYVSLIPIIDPSTLSSMSSHHKDIPLPSAAIQDQVWHSRPLFCPTNHSVSCTSHTFTCSIPTTNYFANEDRKILKGNKKPKGSFSCKLLFFHQANPITLLKFLKSVRYSTTWRCAWGRWDGGSREQFELFGYG